MRYVAFFALSLWALCVASSSPAQIRLNEILADPASDWDGDGEVSTRGDEWVEIINAGSSGVDISRFRLGDASGGFVWRFAFGGTLAPGETRVVYGSDALAWQNLHGFPAFGLSLNNNGDTVFLYEVVSGDTLLADSHTYAPFEVEDDRSAGRQPDGDGDWAVFDALNPYGGSTPPLGTGCMPSPGSGNACVMPVERSTWGVVKSMYRE